LDFYARAFGAVTVRARIEGAKGERSARFLIGEDRFAMADENPIYGAKSPLTLGGAPLCIQLFVDNVGEASRRALAAGGKVMAPGTADNPIFTTEDGTECCNVGDPFGFVWSVSRERA
ncbi:MAG: hypothetical protein FWE09_05810, partial [Treponema sp.]|nr:hypothetical protein [Treponema sp.]